MQLFLVVLQDRQDQLALGAAGGRREGLEIAVTRSFSECAGQPRSICWYVRRVVQAQVKNGVGSGNAAASRLDQAGSMRMNCQQSRSWRRTSSGMAI